VHDHELALGHNLLIFIFAVALIIEGFKFLRFIVQGMP
jgi:hypothetical protein